MTASLAHEVTAALTVACAGCGAVAAEDAPYPARCPAAVPGDDVDHVLTPLLPLEGVRFVASDDPNPFIRFRQLFRAWHVALRMGWRDQRYVDLVRRLDDAVTAVDGRGFRVTPFGRAGSLSDTLGFAHGAGLWVKDETGDVSGSHKARHLMGVMLELLVGEALEPALAERPLAIASCGNAALAAAVVARAAGRRLEVFVPPDADPLVLDRLRRLRAVVEIVPRTPGEPGDPTVARLRAVVAAGAVPFTCQGPENGLAIEGGQTLGYEIAEALGATGERLERIVIQVGGGALASAVARGLAESRRLGVLPALPRIDTVQTTSAWPLRRAHDRIVAELRAAGLEPDWPIDLAHPDADAILGHAARHRSAFMWPWETTPHSVAHGILDDETYDWLAVVRAMVATGGRAIVVDEAELLEANALAVRATAIPVDETGSAGLAGVAELCRHGEIHPDERVAVLFTGSRRTVPASHRSS